MTTYMLIFAAALAFAVGGTPVAKWVAARTDIVDRPSARKLHVAPIPLLGGAAMYLAFVLALLLFGDRFYIHQLVGILVGATLVSFLGVWDDRQTVSPLLKLAGQIAAALVLVLTGVVVDLFPGHVLDIVVTLVWIIGITNALNLLDNMDGLSGGIAAIAAAFFLLLAAMGGQFLVGSLAAAMLGACIGFLRYNFNPAQIFMGDAGSLFLGFVLAAVGIKLRFPGNTYAVTWMIPVLVLGLPIFDTTLVVVSRLRRGKNPLTTGGKDHISHRLVALGWSHREAVLTLYLVACTLGATALFLTQSNIHEAYTVAAAVILAGAFALWKLEF
jgi:UDP-GlcNAc:undecaprenyl-phosphate GlcNAc-1-phosphate transferase